MEDTTLNRVPCAIQYVLISYLFTHGINSVSIPISQFLPPFPLGVHVFVFYMLVCIQNGGDICVCICMAGSFCCRIETNNIVKQLYLSKINLKIIKGWGKCITTIKKKKKKRTTLESQTTLVTKQEQVHCRYLDILS